MSEGIRIHVRYMSPPPPPPPPHTHTHTHTHTGVAFTFSGTPSVGGFHSISCDATVPGAEADSVVIAINGPGGSLVDTAVWNNDVYRGVLLFFSLAESNSGVYFCQVMVDGITVRTATAAINVAGKLETL